MFVEQLVLSLIDGEKRLGRRHTDGLPLMLAEMMSERLDRRPGARRIVQAAACIGRSFRVDFLGELLHEDSKEPANRLEALVDVGFCCPSATVPRSGTSSDIRCCSAWPTTRWCRSSVVLCTPGWLRASRREDAGIPEVIAHLSRKPAFFPRRREVGSWQALTQRSALRTWRRSIICAADWGCSQDPGPGPASRARVQPAGRIDWVDHDDTGCNIVSWLRAAKGLQLCREGPASPLVFPFIFGCSRSRTAEGERRVRFPRGDVPASRRARWPIILDG